MSTPLFPTPVPSDYPTTNESRTIRSLLKRNYETWHVFINEIRFHNHLPYNLLALWSLGASEETLQATYDQGLKLVKPVQPSPEPITRNNFHKHVGDVSYYSGYLEYFTEIGATGLVEALFSRDYNFVDGLKDREQPRMVSRLLDGLLHPLIHVGHGVLYNVPALTIQGMAMTATSLATSGRYVNKALFSVPVYAPETRSHALTVMHRLKKDPRVVIKALESEAVVYKHSMNLNGDIISSYVEDWSLSVNWNCPKAVEKKAEEIIWANTVAYAGPYEESSGHLEPNFFLMHLVTSSTYFRSLLLQLNSATSRAVLTKSYFSASLTWWLAIGGNLPKLQSFYQSTPLTDHNTWAIILRAAIDHGDDHIPKFLRILRTYSDLSQCGKAEIEGAELLDQTFFRRLATKTMDVASQAQLPWSRKLFIEA